MNVDEYGNVLRFNVGEDISSTTNILKITGPYTSNKELILGVADGLAVGTIDISLPDGDYLANQYVTYTFQEGDIDIQGVWQARLSVTLSGNAARKITDKKASFKVYP